MPPGARRPDRRVSSRRHRAALAIPTGATATAAHHPGGVTDWAIRSRRSSFFVTVGEDGKLARSGTRRRWGRAATAPRRRGHLALSPDGVRLAVSSRPGSGGMGDEGLAPHRPAGGSGSACDDLTFTATAPGSAPPTDGGRRTSSRTAASALWSGIRFSGHGARPVVDDRCFGSQCGRCQRDAASGGPRTGVVGRPRARRLCTPRRTAALPRRNPRPASRSGILQHGSREATGHRVHSSTGYGRWPWPRRHDVRHRWRGRDRGGLGRRDRTVPMERRCARVRRDEVRVHRRRLLGGQRLAGLDVPASWRSTPTAGGGIALPNPLTALAVHPTQPIVYGCDAGGAIYLLELV